MAKTLNPEIHIFTDESKARKHYDKQPNAYLLQSTTGISKGNYFVDTCKVPEESAIACWPNHYRLIESKLN